MAIPGMSPVDQADELKKIRPLGTPPGGPMPPVVGADPTGRGTRPPVPTPMPPLGGPGAGSAPGPLGGPASGYDTSRVPPGPMPPSPAPVLGGGGPTPGTGSVPSPVPPTPIPIGGSIPIGPPPSGGGMTTVTPPPASGTTSGNPQQQDAWNYAQQYANSLPGGTNEMITRELQRARDEISVGMKSEGEAAMGRGATPELFRSRAQAAGARNLGDLQGRLADVALGRAEGAGRLLGDISGASAAEQRLMHLGTLGAELDRQRLDISRAESQARLNEMPYERLMRMMDAISRNRDAYASLTELGAGGSGYFGGGGGGGSTPIGGGYGGSTPSGGGGGGLFGRRT